MVGSRPMWRRVYRAPEHRRLDAGIKAHGDGNFIAQSVVPQTPVAMAAFL